MELEKFAYDNRIVKNFVYATLLWGVVGMLVGLIIALQLVLPSLNVADFLSYGRLRPLHTNAVIFAFVGNAIFAGIYYSLQRLLKARMFSDVLSKINFWGWQIIIVSAAITLPLGITTGKEYAELEWPIDIMIAVVWVVFGWNMIGTILKRRVTHLYVAIWFYLATFLAVAILHIFNSLELPVSLFKSYSVYAGVQDALVQWWYGHNAVAFFLTTPFLGLMYYFMPKAANRPVYSYRLSIIHFWALIFIYMWAGPHHLLYTSTPDWVQSLGVTFSIMLIAPSWGGMINGLLTLRGVWDKVREDPILKFLVVAVTAYGMSTFEGPMLSLKSVNAISHYTDWTIGHVHIGALGWNGFMTFGIFYWMVPRLFGTKLASVKAANTHFWLGTLGILFYSIPLYWAGFTQSLMWKEFTDEGFLKYTNFLDTITQILPMYWMRVLGGVLYLTGVVIAVVNLIRTIRLGELIADEHVEAAPLTTSSHGTETWHRKLESLPVRFAAFTLIAVAIGGVVQIVPMLVVKSNVETIPSFQPYSPLELQGRDIYIREGCYNCHSQMIRPFRSETERYGDYSKAGEFVYDHPFQWGSKRTGPDLAREGSTPWIKKSDDWHYRHMRDPLETSPKSIMPAYTWLINRTLDNSLLPAKIRAMQTLGVPYPEGFDAVALDHLQKQADAIVENLHKAGISEASSDKEIIAMIAYLQRLGTMGEVLTTE